MKNFSKLFIAFLLCLFVFGFSGIANAGPLDELKYYIDSDVVPKFYNQTGKPAWLDNGITESIDERSGALSRKEVDITLPGRDGFDLVIGRNFNSSKTDPFTKSVKGETEIDQTVTNATMFSSYDSKTQRTIIAFGRNGDHNDYLLTYMLFTYGNIDIQQCSGKLTVTTYEITERLLLSSVTDQSNLGAGWTWSFPRIESVYSPALGKSKLYYHDSDGGAYEIHMFNSNEGTPLYYPHTIPNGKPFKKCTDYGATYKFTDPRQSTTYFNGQGKPILMKDRFGNQITFQYNTNNHLSAITDTVGRTVNFNYTARNGMDYIDMTVNDPSQTESIVFSYGKGAVTCHGYENGLDSWPSESRQKSQKILSTVIDPLGQTTNYTYETRQTYFTYDKYASDRRGMDAAILLKSVEHPNSKDSYSYEKFNRCLNNNGYAETYRVTKRQTNEFNQNRQVKQSKNIVAYSYAGDYISLDTYYQIYSRQDGDHVARYRYITTKTVMDGSTAVLSETSTFEGRWHRKLESTITNRSGPNAGEKKVISYEYDNTLDWLHGRQLYENQPARVNKPNSVSTTSYSKGAHPHPGETLYTYYTYDPVYNAVQTETLPVTAAQANDDAYKITYGL